MTAVQKRFAFLFEGQNESLRSFVLCDSEPWNLFFKCLHGVYNILIECGLVLFQSGRSSVAKAFNICHLLTMIILLPEGNIIKKLPRKTAVFINDTATFCVELDNDCQNIRWLKNREEVKPSDRISITRSGKQHTMTIRECKMEDAGEIAFLADESRTSTQFTVTSKLLFCLALVLCLPMAALLFRVPP